MGISLEKHRRRKGKYSIPNLVPQRLFSRPFRKHLRPNHSHGRHKILFTARLLLFRSGERYSVVTARREERYLRASILPFINAARSYETICNFARCYSDSHFYIYDLRIYPELVAGQQGRMKRKVEIYIGPIITSFTFSLGWNLPPVQRTTKEYDGISFYRKIQTYVFSKKKKRTIKSGVISTTLQRASLAFAYAFPNNTWICFLRICCARNLIPS